MRRLPTAPQRRIWTRLTLSTANSLHLNEKHEVRRSKAAVRRGTQSFEGVDKEKAKEYLRTIAAKPDFVLAGDAKKRLQELNKKDD